MNSDFHAGSRLIPASVSVIPATGGIVPATGGVIPASGSVIPATGSVIPATGGVIPAECVSTADGFSEQSLPMRGNLFETSAVSFGFYATSHHCIPRLSPQNSHRNAIKANNGAAANRSGRMRASRWLLPPPSPPAAFPQPARRAHPPSAVAELESLAF